MNRLPRTLEMPETEHALAYSAHYEWGSLHVTEKAADEFQLIPLLPVVNGGEIVPRKKSKDSSLRNNDIFVVSSDQLHIPTDPARSPLENLLLGERDQFTHTERYRYGMGLAVVPRISQDGVELLLKNGLNSLFDAMLSDADPELAPSPEEMEEMEAQRQEALNQLHPQLENDAPQLISHTLATQIGEEFSAQKYSLYQEMTEKKLAGAIRRGPILSLSFLVGTSIPYMFIDDGPIDKGRAATNALLAVMFGVFGTHNSQREAREILRAQEKIPTIAEIEGRIVSSDVHELYCRKHFDARFDEL